MLAAIPYWVDVLVGLVIGAWLVLGFFIWLRFRFHKWLEEKIDRRIYLREHGFDSEEQLEEHNRGLEEDRR